MARRLRIIYVGLLACVLLGLAVPLAFTLTDRSAQVMFIDRLNDAARFASLADPALRTGRFDALRAELGRYDQTYGIGVAVVGRDGRILLASSGRVSLDGATARERMADALAGRQVGLADTTWPWEGDPMVVAMPVDSEGEVIGAVVTVSPTGALRWQIGRDLGALVLIGLVVLGVGVAAARPFVRWLLRPVERLDRAAGDLSEGNLSGRVDVESGPPELRRLSGSFNHMADRIGVLLQRQRDFVSYASHQLRTPLATLRLAVENLSDSVGPRGRPDYDAVAEEISRLGDLCDSLLTYARAEVTAVGAGDEPVDAVSTVERRIALWRRVAEQSGVRLVRAGSDRAPVHATEQALDQVVDALVSNAVKYAGAGAQVVVAVEGGGPDAEWVDIHVVDDGPGIATGDLARASEPFWRKAYDQDVQGSGLGITIVTALVAASGGRFELRPARPHGLHAWVRLPAARPALIAHSGQS